eukprot:1951128-Rhodomonas_salina.1
MGLFGPSAEKARLRFAARAHISIARHSTHTTQQSTDHSTSTIISLHWHRTRAASVSQLSDPPLNLNPTRWPAP